MSISLNQFINLNDQQLYQMAQYQTALDADQKKLTNNSLLFGIPLMDSFARAAVQEGEIGTKVATFGNRMLGWVGFLAIASVYNTALDSVKKNIPAVQDFEEKHPVISTALNVIGLWGAVDYAHKGFNKVTKLLKNKYPDKFEMLDLKKQNIVDTINTSWVDSKVYKPTSKVIKSIEKRFPEAAIGLKTVLPWVAPLVVASAFTKSMCMVKNMNAKTQENFKKLKDMQHQFQERFEKE